jgi:uncharacterized protein with gpF-like domain
MRVDVRGNALTHHIERGPVEKMIVELYKTVGSDFARQQFERLKAENQSMIFKSEPDEDNWRSELEGYAKTKAGQRITSITEGSRNAALKIIRSYLERSVNEGWGSEETARAIRKGLVTDGIEMNQWRALRIARTEIVTASNIGTLVGARSSEFTLEKYWIATQDSRTRETHAVIEVQNPKAMDEGFLVGAYEMECPGDPDGGPEETINCRCALATEVKQ